MTSDLDLLKTFAPVVRLHPWDHHRPSSVDAFLKRASLYNSDNEVIVNHPTPEQLVAEQQEDCYLAWDSEQTIPTKDNNRYTGLPTRPIPDRPGEAACEAPCYARVFPEAEYTDLVYSFYYEFNGFQTIHSKILVKVREKNYRFEWANFGRHQGDWEHVTVRVKTPEMVVLGVFFTGHGGTRYVPYDRVTYADPEHRRVIVYSALNSHASYPDQVTTTLKQKNVTFLPFIGLDFIDCTEPVDDRLKVYDVPDPTYSRVEWDTAPHMVDAAVDPQASLWMQFKYPWGQNRLDNSDIQKAPGGLPANAGWHAKNWANFLKPIVLEIAKKELYPKGPANPQARDWFRDKEAAPQLVQTETIGGPHGGDFNDAAHVAPTDRITGITIYSGERVDALAVAYSNGYVVEHGNSGKGKLGESSMALAPDEFIVRMGGTTVKKSGHSRVGYLEIITNKGQRITGGHASPAEKWVVDNSKPRQAPFAFYGRSGDELDKIGLVLSYQSPFASFDEATSEKAPSAEPA